MKNNSQDILTVLRSIYNNPNQNQRKLAKNLKVSLGKLNYLIKTLKSKGLIKIQNFKNNKNKMRYVYILTPRGISKKTNLTINFVKRKMKEYDQLKKELEEK
jgi:EPS-associated MarR family transcriptional regulator